MRLKALSLAALMQSTLIPSAHSGQLLNSPYGDFSAGVNVEDSSDLVGVYSIAMTLQILDRSDRVSFGPQANDEDVNLLFFSGSGFIDQGRVSRQAIKALPDEVIDAVVSQPTNTEVCYVQGFKFGSQRMVISVHDTENAKSEDVYRCFTAAVWYFKFGNVEGFDANQWREMLAKLIGDSAVQAD